MKIYRSVSLEQWNEVSFSCDTEAANSIQLYTDKWLEDLPKEEDKEMVRGMRIIPYCDCFTSMQSPLAVTFGPRTHLFYCNYDTTVIIIHRGRSKALSIKKLRRQFTLCSVKFNFCIP